MGWAEAALFAAVLTIIVVVAFFNSQLALGQLAISCPKCERYPIGGTPLTHYASTLALGFVSGISPCLIVIIPVVIQLTPTRETRKKFVVRTALLIAGGVFYAYLIIPNIMILIPDVIQILKSSATFLGLGLVVLGVSVLAEFFYRIRNKKRLERQSYGGPVSKTPAKVFCKSLSLGNPYFYFLIGVVFSVVELCCVGSLLLVSLPFAMSRPAVLFASVILFDVGLIIPLIVVAFLVSVGLLGMEQTRALHSRMGLVRRIIVGIALIAAGLLIFW